MLKVCKDFITDAKGKYRKVSYKDVEYDFDEWADASNYLPADLDLMYLKTEKKTFTGWRVGNKWDGAKISHDERVFFWKRFV